MTRRSVQKVADKAGLSNNKIYTSVVLAGEIYEIFNTARGQIKQYREKLNRRHKYFVSIIDTDDVYKHVQRWLMQGEQEQTPRSIIVESHGTYQMRKLGSYYSLLYDHKANIEFTHKGHKYTAKITDRDDNPEEDSPDSDSGIVARARNSNTFHSRLLFECESEKAREALLETFGAICKDHVDDVPSVYIAAKWGDWLALRDAPARELESVILRDDDRERIAADVQKFLASEEVYAKMGLPWHRGYLLWGDPGTGKTSLARALASHFRLNAYFLSLSSLDKDTDLSELLTRIPPRSVILFEDIDVVHSARERDDDSGVTLAGLLNALDGFVTPHGVIIVMTTNRRDVLDEALCRPGRVDMELHIPSIDDDQLHRMVEFYTGSAHTLPSLQTDDVTPGQVMDIFKNYLDAPESAVTELVNKIKVDWV